MTEPPFEITDDAPWPAEGEAATPQPQLVAGSDQGAHGAPDRNDLLIKNWLTRELPERDYLLGSTICSTSRWLIFGDTGVGKTLVAMAIAGAIASGQPFLNWGGRHPARVMYLDGELPAETFKERMEMLAKSWGDDIAFFGYSREVLSNDDMPPLNGEAGQKWLMAEIAAVKPDIVFFDSIMCLLVGSMSEEEAWAPMKPMVRALSARRIAQVWLNHTGHDASRSFGTKTREWEMDTVLGLFKVDQDDELDTAIRLEFRKARLRTPATAAQFAPCIVRLVDGEWVHEGAAPKRSGKQSDAQVIQNAILDAYGRFADGASQSHGFDGKPVRKVSVDKIRDEVKSRGFLDTNERGHITNTARSNFARAKTGLIAAKKLIESEGLIWRP
jgi:hypothetical protein